MAAALWLVLYDASWNKLTNTAGPILLTEASVTRPLDGVGTIKFSTAARDKRAIQQLTAYRRFKIYYDQAGTVREFASGLVMGVTRSYADGAYTRSYTAVDRLHELVIKSTQFNRIYPAATSTISSIATALAALASWTATVETAYASNAFEARFDGTNAYKALASVVETAGIHFRQAIGASVVELGLFGVDAGVRCVSANSLHPMALVNDGIALIASIGVELESKDIYNKVIPSAAGEGEAKITLEGLSYSDIQTTTGPDGRSVYSLINQASIDLYGTIEKTVSLKKISPVYNTDASILQAKVQLYTSAKADLQRHADPQIVYRLAMRKVRAGLRPGDRVRVVWQGEIVDDDGRPIAEEDINADFFIVRVDEKIDGDGKLSTSLAVSNIDKVPESPENKIVSAMEEIETRSFQRLTFPVLFSDTYTKYIEAGNVNASFSFRLDANITDITSVRINVRTEPLTTFSRYNAPQYTIPFVAYTTPLLSPNVGMEFQVFADTQYPSGISLYINGTDRSAAFGGPWNVATNAALDLSDLDITQYLRSAPGGLRQTHTIVFTCTTRTGNIGYPPGGSSASGEASHGNVELKVITLGVAQSAIPA